MLTLSNSNDKVGFDAVEFDMRCCSLLCLAALAAMSSASAKERVYRPPRVSDGHVDMQGTWKNSNLTPLERPDQFPRLILTQEEATKFKKQYEDEMLADKSPEDPGGLLESRQIEPIGGKLRSSLIIDPEDGRIPFTASFKERAAAARPRSLLNAVNGPEQRPPLERCLYSTGAPPMQPTPDNNHYQIVQTPHEIVISSEIIHDARIVRMNGVHRPAAVTSWLGDSVGWWEGDTLVVETKFFPRLAMVHLHGRSPFFVSSESTVLEKFTRVANDEINYMFTVNDATYYTRPWTGETHFLRTSDRMFEFACHEGNYGMRFILEGARAVDASQ